MNVERPVRFTHHHKSRFALGYKFPSVQHLSMFEAPLQANFRLGPFLFLRILIFQHFMRVWESVFVSIANEAFFALKKEMIIVKM